MLPEGFFLGNHFGLASAGDDFVATFAQPDKQNITSIFLRRVGTVNAGDATLNSTGSDPIMLDQKTKQCIPNGVHCNSNTDCCGGFCGPTNFPGVLKHDHFVCL